MDQIESSDDIIDQKELRSYMKQVQYSDASYILSKNYLETENDENDMNESNSVMDITIDGLEDVN